MIGNNGEAPQLLLVDADDHEPALKSGAPLHEAPEPLTNEMPKFLWSLNSQPNDLPVQR